MRRSVAAIDIADEDLCTLGKFTLGSEVLRDDFCSAFGALASSLQRTAHARRMVSSIFSVADRLFRNERLTSDLAASVRRCRETIEMYDRTYGCIK
jgi:hypothetical protein